MLVAMLKRVASILRNGSLRKWGIRVAITLGVLALPPLSYYLYVGVWQSNFHTVIPGRIYRSGNPSSNDIINWTRQYGLKTVIDLRADGVSRAYPDEQHAANQAGVALQYIKLSATHQPSGETLRKLILAIEGAQEPLLMHCEGGADRAGLASFIAAMAIGGQDYEQATTQFSARYFHLDTDLPITRVLHDYRQYCKDNNLSTAGWKQFRQWAFNVYSCPDSHLAAG